MSHDPALQVSIFNEARHQYCCGSSSFRQAAGGLGDADFVLLPFLAQLLTLVSWHPPARMARKSPVSGRTPLSDAFKPVEKHVNGTEAGMLIESLQQHYPPVDSFLLATEDFTPAPFACKTVQHS